MKNLNCILSLFIIIIGGCGIHSYSPPLAYIPAEHSKGDFHIATALGLSGFNTNVVYAVTNKFGTMASFHYSLDADLEQELSYSYQSQRQQRSIGEISAYWFPGKKQNKKRTALMFGGGMGNYFSDNKETNNGPGSNLQHEHYFVDSRIKYYHFFIGPYFYRTSPSGMVNFYYSTRLTFIHYDQYNITYRQGNSSIIDTYSYSIKNPTAVVFEPGFQFTVGKKNLKLLCKAHMPISIVNIYTTPENKRIPDAAVFSLQVGFVINFHDYSKN